MWKDNIKMNMKQNGGAYCISVSQNKGKWGNLMKLLTNHQVSQEVTNMRSSLCKQQFPDMLLVF